MDTLVNNLNYSLQDSITSILRDEAQILKCMSIFMSCECGVKDMVICNDSIHNKMDYLNIVIQAYCKKECSIADIILAECKLSAVDKNIHYCDIDNIYCKEECNDKYKLSK